ncbi:MAG: hypothetical protein JJT81_11710 [Rubellimicrobium sp.]|nr:hypothetical protein [Rubellimicrobium sp.]
MRSVPVLALALLAACAASVPVPCACVLPLVPNGLVSLRLDGRDLAFEGGASTIEVAGALYQPDTTAGRPVEFTLETAGFFLLATLTGPQGAGLLERLDIGPGLGGTAEASVDTSRALAPTSGTVQLREIAQQDGGYRIRGRFSAEVCTDAQNRIGCRPLSGNFAFDAVELPEGAEALLTAREI